MVNDTHTHTNDNANLLSFNHKLLRAKYKIYNKFSAKKKVSFRETFCRFVIVFVLKFIKNLLLKFILL